jgi:putative DNA primase/helicase
MPPPSLAAVAQQCEGAHKDKQGWRARCPVHQGETDSSLHLWEEDGQIRVHCFAGCERRTILDALHIERIRGEPVYQGVYSYHDASGHILFQVVRLPGERKQFIQRRPDPVTPGKWINDRKGITTVLYHLPEVSKAIVAGLTIYIVEGEKDVETLRSHGLVATCNPGGAGKWEDRYSEALKNAQVILLPDNDKAGSAHADLVTARLAGYAQSLRRVDLPDLPERGDITDWLTAGHTIDDLKALTAKTKSLITAPHMVVKSFADITPETIEWLWEPYIPYGKFTVLEGDPGLGKTFLLLAIATANSLGTGLPAQNGHIQGGKREPITTLYITAEDGYADTLVPRATSMKADLRYVKAVLGWTTNDVDMQPFSLAQLALLEEAIRDVKAKLVILDPLQAFLGATVDMHRANEVRPLLTLIGNMAEAQHCAVVAVRHWNKSAGGKAVYRGLGSIDFTAHARSVLVIGESPDDESIRILAQSKSALTIKGRSQMFRIADQKFEWCGSCDVDADTLASIQPNKRRHQRENAMDWLKDYLRDEPQPALAVIVAAEAVGISKGTLQRAKAALGILSSKEGRDGQWYWRLPDFKPWDRRGPEDDDNNPPF